MTRDPTGRPDREPRLLDGLDEVAAERFYEQFVTAKAGRRGPWLTSYTLEEFRPMRCFLANEGKTGGALKPTPPGTELVSLFNLGGPRGAGQALARHLIHEGARRLDCIGNRLRRMYEELGFVVVERFEWDDERAPEDWAYDRDGRPPVFVMQLRRG